MAGVRLYRVEEVQTVGAPQVLVRRIEQVNDLTAPGVLARVRSIELVHSGPTSTYLRMYRMELVDTALGSFVWNGTNWVPGTWYRWPTGGPWTLIDT